MKPGTDFHSFYRNLDELAKADIDGRSQKIWAPAGTILCKLGSPSDSVFIIEEGVAEVIMEQLDNKESSPIAYLSRGDIIGELGILNDRPRSATIRVAADLYFRRIRGEDFLKLLATLPGFGLYINYRLAERLASTTANLAYNSYCNDLSGKLPQFDLLTVFQTVRDSGRSGELKLIGKNKEILGHFFCNNGRVTQGRYLHLAGTEALWQVFLETDLTGAFTFTRSDNPSVVYDDSFQLDLPISDLLVAAAVKRDEFKATPEKLRNLQGSIKRNALRLNWKDEPTRRAAEQIWELIEREPQPLRTLWRRSTQSVLTLTQVIATLLATKQVAEVEESSPKSSLLT